MRVLACLLLACLGCTSELRPFGEAIVIVDTDAPVPKLVNTLRVDFYRDDGTWFDTLETRALGPEAWPVSFSVFNEDETTTRAVVLRLRAYSAGKVRDYRGERFSDRPIGAPRDPVPDPIPPQNGDPRLVRDGLDITPATEPLPNLTIDRLARIELPPGEVGASMLVLRAACAGTMANLATRESCIDVEGVRGPLTTLPVETGLERPASLAGSAFTFEPCPAEAPDPDAVCVPGGVLFLGDPGLAVLLSDYRTQPERIAVIPTLLVDTYEVTVARWREALASGFEPPLGGPARNNIDEPLADSWVYRGPRLCTWSTIPLATYPREDYPINCVLLEDVRAFCEWRGGDLLTEAQWEYVAGAAGRDAESFYPWGNEPPGCEGVVYARQNDENKGGVACQTLGFGPRPVQEGALDVTAHGVRGLAGSVAEWVSDDFRSYRTVCWAAQPLHDPHCVDDSAPHGAVRGGSWVQTVLPAHARTSNAKSAGHIDLGFRCARQVQP